MTERPRSPCDGSAPRSVGDRRRILGAIGLLVGGAAVLALVGLLTGPLPVDRWVLGWARVPPDSLAGTSVGWASSGLRLGAGVATIVAVVVLVRRGGARTLGEAAAYVLLFVGLAGSSELLKPVFERPHPTDPSDWAFPSTHVAMVAIGVVVTVAIARRLSPSRSTTLAALGATAVALTACTRVLLAEHHLSDVLASALGYSLLAIGASMLVQRWTVGRRRQHVGRRPRPRTSHRG